jgi:hypothetical protein
MFPFNISYHDIVLLFLNKFGLVMKIYLVLFIVGIIHMKPIQFLEANFVIKILLAAFLIYRFNPYFQNNRHFTELDRKISFSAGCFILLITFADFVEYFIQHIRGIITPHTLPWIEPIVSRLMPPSAPPSAMEEIPPQNQ